MNEKAWYAVSGISGLIAMIGIVLVIAVGGYGAYWWLAKDTTEKRYEVNTGTQQYQSGLIAQERNLALDYSRAVDPGQKQAIADQFCAIFPNIKPAPTDLATAASTICL